MRKTALIIFALAAASFAGHAQTAYDALLFSENNYEGTARSVAMGNAFTALGGDLGGISINPAGSAVAGYSQFSITPSLSLSSTTTQGVSPYSDGTLPYFERQMKSNMTRFNIPNFGLSINWDTGRKTGLKNMSFGFVVNMTNSWNEDVYANGHNETTSFMGAMAAEATANGYLGSELSSDYAYDFFPWKTVVGFDSYMIDTFGGYDDQFVGASELIFNNGDIALGGAIEQTYGRRTTGSKYEYLFNIGANISDFVYLGANLGISSINYSSSEYFKEEAIDPANFENAQDIYWQSMKYNYNYSASGTGYFAKVGIIVTPGAGLRIGAAVTTPVVNTIEETWQHSGRTSYTSAQYDASATSPEGYGSYSFTAPFRANFGLAYTLGQLGVISADYEICDYSQMRYSTSGSDRDYFDSVNADIRERFGASHMLRAGLEVKPISSLAIRAGYGLTTSAEKIDSYGNSLETLCTQNASLGLGYSSPGSFFADLAVKRSFLSDEYFMPYDDYIFDAEGYVAEYAPEILNKRSLWKVMITFGWRF